MTAIDVAIVVFALALGLLGYERGFIGSVLPLIGFVAGAAIGGRLGPALLSQGSESPYAPIVTVLGGLVVGFAFAVAMEGIADILRMRFPRGSVASRIDGVGGAIVLALLALLLAWAFGAAALQAPGPGARDLRATVQNSTILRALNDLLPPSGPLLTVLRRIDPTPAVTGPQARVAPPRPAIAHDPDVMRAGESVVKVLGTACGLGVEGSGWVAAPGLVVTNAHVVAGESDTTVTSRAGAQFDATAVSYDPHNDLALLRVPGLSLPALSFAASTSQGTGGAVLGYPENGPFAVAPARLAATEQVISQDSYGRGPVTREMTPFRGQVQNGNSGGPVVDASGNVLTTVFASQQGGGPPSGLGVPNDIVHNALGGRLTPVSTGACTA